MLAVVKEPHIELTLGGANDKIAELLEFIRSRYTVEILTGIEPSDNDDEAVDVFSSDFWKEITPGDLLAGCRLKHGLTQEQLAEKSGIHQVVISAYETGKRKLSQRAAIKLARALNEKPESFFRNIIKKQHDR